MARIAIVLALAVVAIIAIQTTKVLGVASGGSCGLNDTCDPCPPQYGPVCCNGLTNGVADDGSLFAINDGTCSCCNAEGSDNVCRTDKSSAIITNSDGDGALVLTQSTSCQSENP